MAEPVRITAAMVARCHTVAEPRWSRDGRWVAWVDAFDGSLVYVAGDGALLAVPSEGGPPTVLSRDGRARGEGHGFRSAVVIEQELERTERFLRRWELER